jgi:uncharacterized protein YjbJ (UPF0337 family)
MNQDIIQGKWKQLKGSLKTKWSKLTNDDLERLDGNHDYLVGKLQERYGYAKDRAEQEIRDFTRSVDRAA